VAQAFDLSPVIVDVGAEPGAGVRNSEQPFAAGVDDQPGIAAEILRLAEEIDAAPPDELAEVLPVRIVAVEIDRDGGDLDLLDARRHVFRLVGERRRHGDERQQSSNARSPAFAQATLHAKEAQFSFRRLLRAWRGEGRPACRRAMSSSNSSASLSV